MKISRRLPLLAALAGLASSALAVEFPTYRVRAEKILDGDTGIFVVTDGRLAAKKFTVRLAGIDAPETKKSRSQPGQPLALEAKRFLEQQTDHRVLRLTVTGSIDAQTLIGSLDYWVLDQQVVVNTEMVRAGFAEVVDDTGLALPAATFDQLTAARAQAVAAKEGIWRLPEHERPAGSPKRLASD